MKRLKYSSFALISISLLMSCEKYLDKNPDMRTEINTAEKVAALVTSAYPQYNYLGMAETYSDNVSDKGPDLGHIDEPYVSLYFWQDIEDSGNNTPTQYWNGVYSGIAAANQALEAIELNDFGDEILQYKGEALVARAYGHFMLVTFFAQMYNPNGSNDSPGIPYVDKPEKIALQQYSRGTVASVYERIEEDLLEGLPLLRGGQWQVPKYHFTPAAAAAFAARFYLFKGEYDKVIHYANQIFPNGDFTGNIRPWNTQFKGYTTAEFIAEFSKPSKNFNLLLTETYSVYQRSSSSGQTRYGFSTDKYNELWMSNTAAGAPFYSRGLTWGTGNYTPYNMNEYFFYTNQQAGIGFPYIMQPLFVTDEALLNRAEAYIRLGDFDRALADLNYYASQRVDNYTSANHRVTIEKSKDHFGVSDDAQALIETVLQFKQVAFYGEGMRWLDLARLKIPVVHNHIAPNGEETFETLGADDLRRVFQIPQEASIAGVGPNPR